MTGHADIGWAAHVHPAPGGFKVSQNLRALELPSENCHTSWALWALRRMGVCEEPAKRLETEEGKRVQVWLGLVIFCSLASFSKLRLKSTTGWATGIISNVISPSLDTSTSEVLSHTSHLITRRTHTPYPIIRKAYWTWDTPGRKHCSLRLGKLGSKQSFGQGWGRGAREGKRFLKMIMKL